MAEEKKFRVDLGVINDVFPAIQLLKIKLLR